MAEAGGLHFRVLVDDESLREDLAHATPAARAAIEEAVEYLRDHGAPFDLLGRCEAEGRDGTRLPNCVKLYVPMPFGQWGVVLSGAEDSSGVPFLILLAAGDRHPTNPHRPSVYEIASRRLSQAGLGV